MSLNVEDILAQIFDKVDKGLDWNEGMIRTKGPGHTREVSGLPYTHVGRLNSQYYVAATIHGALDEEKGLELLHELSKLQVKEPSSRQRGGFRWYREETAIADTNAAFFIMMPLVFFRLYYPERIPASHIPVLDEMMSHSLHWFHEECANPILYYPNKIMSDGSMLLGISAVLKNETGFKAGVEFYNRWEEYTERRGWGWGENTSFIYLAIILNALQLARKALGDKEKELGEKLWNRIHHALEYVRFHGGKEMIPTIRTYNFDGQETVYGWVNAAAGVRFIGRDVWGDSMEKPLSSIISLKMFEEVLGTYGDVQFKEPDEDALINAQKDEGALPCIRTEKIFDDTFAYTWKGKNGRLGSVSKFPVIPGCYQHPTWGLGWQSMPVNFLVEGEQMGFLRMYVQEGDNLRAHPAIDKHKSYLNPALFREPTLPVLGTYCAQNENLLLTVRSIGGLCNAASRIADTWVINRFEGEVKTFEIHTTNGSGQKTVLKNDNSPVTVAGSVEAGRPWVVLKYDQAAVAITALSILKVGDKAPCTSKIEVIQENDNVMLQQVIYEGEEVFHCQQRVETGWGIVLIDEKPEDESLVNFLSRLEISDMSIPDFEVPRDGFTLIRYITLTTDEGKYVHLRYDPHYE